MGQTQTTPVPPLPAPLTPPPKTHPLETGAAPFSRLSFQATRVVGSTGNLRPALEFIQCTGPRKASESSIAVRWYAGEASAARKRWTVILAALWNEGVSSPTKRVPLPSTKPVHHPHDGDLEHGWEFPLPANGQPGLADYASRFLKLQLFPGTRQIFLFRKDGMGFSATVCRKADEKGFSKEDAEWDCDKAWLRLAKQMVLAAPFSFTRYITNTHLLAFVQDAEKERDTAFAKTSTDPPLSPFLERLKYKRAVPLVRAVPPPPSPPPPVQEFPQGSAVRAVPPPPVQEFPYGSAVRAVPPPPM